ncbi:uncharacterized protein LOC110715621 [Chenopodium quinoa]|uniref:uncharacterized protein LOC110715621 n=1 Tax=Chenopodium quinoa TaxID=63459 RepID=UPI000B7922A3|nr:uncharacterized protein LOC110715621 [Chenopodium quinoa]
MALRHLRAGGVRVRWQPPNEGWVKLNVDGGGEVQFAAARVTEDRWQPLIAEAKALFFGLQTVVNTGFQRVVVESDCLGLINAIVSQDVERSDFYLILDDIYHMSGFLESVSWSFVRREGSKVWLSNFPSCIVNSLKFDLPMDEN